MLSINPKNRPTISTILEKPFLKKKVANYIYDFIKNSEEILSKNNLEKVSDYYLEQSDILKEQAEKLGVFNYLVKDLNANVHVKDPLEDKQILDVIDSEKDKILCIVKYNSEQKYNSNEDCRGMSNTDDREGLGVKDETYLKRKNEERQKIEDRLNELEKKKRNIFSKIKSRIVSKKDEKLKQDKTEIDNNNNLINPVKKNPYDIKVSSAYNSKTSDVNYISDSNLTNNENLLDKRKILPVNHSVITKFDLKQNNLKRPESSVIYKSNRKVSDGDIEREKEQVIINHNKKKVIKNNSSSRSPDFKAVRHLRPATGLKDFKISRNLNRNNSQSEIYNDLEQEEQTILQTIREENDESLLREKNNLKKVTEEIRKMKEYLEKTKGKIDKIVKKINTNDDSKATTQSNQLYSGKNVSNKVDREEDESCRSDNPQEKFIPDNLLKIDTEKTLIKNPSEDDGSSMILEKIKQFRQYLNKISYLIY